MELRTFKKYTGDERTFDAQYSESTKIDELIEYFNLIKSQGATDVELLARAYDGDSDEVEITPFYWYTETEEECLKRETEETKRQETAKDLYEQNQRKLYESLKAKYG